MKSMVIGCVVLLIPMWANAANLQGKVLDESKKPPKDGIAAAEVILTDKDGKSVANSRTDGLGEFRVNNLPNGTYGVTVNAGGYDTHQGSVVLAENKSITVSMWASNPNAAYYEALVTNIVASIGDKPPFVANGLKEAAWKKTMVFNMQPASRVNLAQAWVKQDKNIGETVPEIKLYSNAKQKAVADVQARFIDATSGKAALPKTADIIPFELHETIVADIVVYCLRSTAGTEKTRKAFQDDFSKQWQGTKVNDGVASKVNDKNFKLPYYAQDR